MPSVEIAGRKYETDGAGFFTDHQNWSSGVGVALAKAMQVELGPRHFVIMNFLRDFYMGPEHRLPRVRELCVGVPTSIRELYELFPAGLSLACKFAGLPKPGCGS